MKPRGPRPGGPAALAGGRPTAQRKIAGPQGRRMPPDIRVRVGPYRRGGSRSVRQDVSQKERRRGRLPARECRGAGDSRGRLEPSARFKTAPDSDPVLLVASARFWQSKVLRAGSARPANCMISDGTDAPLQVPGTLGEVPCQPPDGTATLRTSRCPPARPRRARLFRLWACQASCT